MDKIILIDGNSIINRAFYALPVLTNKNGDYTNGVYGFFTILFKFINEEKPTHIGVAFDVHAPTFRHKAYEEYKGTRKPMPEELRPQIPLLKELLKKMNIAVCEKEGFEADDILGTLARRSEAAGLLPVVVSGDRDLLQIATDVTKIRIPKTKGFGTEVEDFYAKDVFEKYGVSPQEFIEVKALMGDSSDNVPGVPSIGEKTAIKIIQKYKTVENAIENASEIKPARAAENLGKFREQAMMSKFLVTINTDVPVEWDIEDFRIKDMFNKDAGHAFAYNDFKSLLPMFETDDRESKRGNVRTVKTREDAAALAKELKGLCAYKTIMDGGVFCGCAFADGDGNISVVLTETEINLVDDMLSEDEFIEIFGDFFGGNVKKLTYDVKSDIVHFKNKMEINNVAFDSILGAYILDPSASSYEYNEVAYNYLGISLPSLEDIFGKGKSRTPFYNAEEEKLVSAFSDFVYVIAKSYNIINDRIKESGQEWLYYEVELPLAYVLADMECVGMKIDREELIAFSGRLDEKLSQIQKDIYWLAGEEFNINSPKQLSIILFEKLGLKGGKKTKTGWSTSADVLEKLKDKDEIVEKILSYRTYAKLKSTYCDGLLAVLDKKTDRVYSTFHQTITATGRISSAEPNLQNIPIKLELGRLLRKAFIPSSEDYVFADGDYSQIELRVLAHLSGDETLINAFINGEDIHRLTASQAFGIPYDEVTPAQRSNAKAVNFGIVYGISAFALSEDLKISRAEAQKYIDGYFEKYPGIKVFMDNCVRSAKEKGYSVTMFNRIRKIPELSAGNFNLRSFGERVAMNAPIQGTAADIIKLAMIKIWRRLRAEGLKSRLLLQVHDELLIEAHKDEVEYVNRLLKEEMENAVRLSVPLSVDVHNGRNWYEVK